MIMHQIFNLESSVKYHTLVLNVDGSSIKMVVINC